MLNEKEIMDRYKEIRQYTAVFSGETIIDIERYVREVTASHIEALEQIKKYEDILIRSAKERKKEKDTLLDKIRSLKGTIEACLDFDGDIICLRCGRRYEHCKSNSHEGYMECLLKYKEAEIKRKKRQLRYTTM